MPSPFPGMDPYLEAPRLWSSVHHALLSAIQGQLAPLLRPRYIVRANERAYLSAEGSDDAPDRVPDVHVVAGLNRPLPGGPTGTATMADPVRVIDLFEQETHEFFLEITSPQDGSVVTVIEVLSPSNKARGSAGRASFLHERREVYAAPAHWLEIDPQRAIDDVVVGGGYDITFKYDADPPPPMTADNLGWCRERVRAWKGSAAPID